MKVTIVGYSKFTSKKGNKVCKVRVTYEPSSVDVEKFGAIGVEVFDGFTPKDFNPDELTEECIGKEVDARFSFYNNQMNMVDLVI